MIGVRTDFDRWDGMNFIMTRTHGVYYAGHRSKTSLSFPAARYHSPFHVGCSATYDPVARGLPDVQNPERSHRLNLDGKLGQGLAEYRLLANALPQIIWTCDAEGRLEWVNDRWLELTGLTEEETLTTRGRSSRCTPTIAEIARVWTEALAHSTPCEIEYRIRTPGRRLSLAPGASGPGPGRGRRDHVLGVGRVRHARSANGGGRAARVRAAVRDRLPPESAADGHHAHLGRHVTSASTTRSCS